MDKEGMRLGICFNTLEIRPYLIRTTLCFIICFGVKIVRIEFVCSNGSYNNDHLRF